MKLSYLSSIKVLAIGAAVILGSMPASHAARRATPPPPITTTVQAVVSAP